LTNCLATSRVNIDDPIGMFTKEVCDCLEKLNEERSMTLNPHAEIALRRRKRPAVDGHL